jgi:hypothetical protein
MAEEKKETWKCRFCDKTIILKFRMQNGKPTLWNSEIISEFFEHAEQEHPIELQQKTFWASIKKIKP